MDAVESLVFELCFRREAYEKVGHTYVRDEEKDATLPARPPQFTAMTGSQAAIAERAHELNQAQRRSGFIHYFFFPDVVSNENRADHCDACRRIHRKSA